MSRCFPFPASDLSRKDSSEVGSIKKLQIEGGKKNHSNKKIWENKENKKECSRKKENRKRSRQQDKHEYPVHEKKKLRRDQVSDFFDSFQGWKRDSSDPRERSGVTEEQGLPSSVSNPCNSSESTQNSSMTSKLLAVDSKRKDQGLVLRIQLPLTKHRTPMTYDTSTEPCSSRDAAASTNISRPSSAAKTSCLIEKTSVRQQELHSTPANGDPCFSCRVSETPMIEVIAAAANFSSTCDGESGHRNHCRRRRLKMEKSFSNLVLNWNPSSLPSYDPNPGCQDWLFAPARQSSRVNQCVISCKTKPDRKAVLVSTSSIQPQACYLPEFDIYQLPYVIPF